MSSKVELILKRIKLIQEGKEEEAQKVLEQYWKLCENKNSIQEVEVKPVIEDKKKQKVQEIKKEETKYPSIDSLIDIKGIGKETVKDLKVIYPSIEELIKELKTNKDIPLRNDIEKLLRNALLN